MEAQLGLILLIQASLHMHLSVVLLLYISVFVVFLDVSFVYFVVVDMLVLFLVFLRSLIRLFWNFYCSFILFKLLFNEFLLLSELLGVDYCWLLLVKESLANYS